MTGRRRRFAAESPVKGRGTEKRTDEPFVPERSEQIVPAFSILEEKEKHKTARIRRPEKADSQFLENMQENGSLLRLVIKGDDPQ